MQYCTTPSGDKIAYVYTQATTSNPDTPCIVFCGGFRSDMTGTKATELQTWAQAQNLHFLRFDYHGHGASSGQFINGCIGRWAQNTYDLLQHIPSHPLILVGSSMGGWIALLIALRLRERVRGLVGIAAAPDFTQALMWEQFSPQQQDTLMQEGILELPSEYGEPTPITRQLIEDGRNHLLLHQPIEIHCPVRLLHGMEDVDVPWQISVELAERIMSQDVQVMLIKDGDHRLSRPQDIALLQEAVNAVIEKAFDTEVKG